MEGIYMNKINLYYRIAEPGILYINNASNQYQGIWLDNLFVDDTSPNLDWSTITIETCAAITDSTDPALSAYTVIPTTKIYTENGTALKTNGNIEGQYIKGTWLYTSAATAKTTTSKIATIESDNFVYYITPYNLRNTMGLGDTTGALPTANGGTGNTSYTANRLVYSKSATKLNTASSLYATDTSLAVNKTSITSGFNFEVAGKTLLDNTTASSTTNQSGQLVVSNSNSGNVAIELWRNANASWQLANESGVFYLRNNFTSAK